MFEKLYYVYILTNKSNTVFYIGVTSNLLGRVWTHREKILPGFTSRYNIYKLVYYEVFNNPINAIEREKQLKRWRREKKISLIIKQNPNYKDLSKDLE